MERRALLGGAAATLAAAATGAGASPSTRFLNLQTPVVTPVSQLQTVWAAVPFKARFTKSNGEDSVLPGIAVRTPRKIKAFCLYCPHELCVIKFTDDHQLRCPCHFSLFDPLKDGAWISGPAMRRTYRFDYHVKGPDLVINGIEADLERRLL
jgi:Rieske Fe-S protein